MKAPFTPEMPLRMAQDKLRELVDEGHECPCCTQFAKVYQRKIHASMAAGLVKLYRRSAEQFTFWGIAEFLAHRELADFAKLAYWGLVEEEAVSREDGGRAGCWRVTDKGQRFVLGHQTVPKYARIYNGRCLGWRGDPVTIRDALGDKFNYDELMSL